MSRSPPPTSSLTQAGQDPSSLSPFDQQDPPDSPDASLRPTPSTRSMAYSPLGIFLDDGIQNNRNGSYATLNRPTSQLEMEEADGESLLSHRRTGSQPHVTHYDRMDSWNRVVKTGTNKLLMTVFFGGVLCLCLKSWEGFNTPIALSDWDVRVFNGLTIAISICLGLNLLASLKRYAVILRWSILTKTYVSMEVFDLILGIDELTNVTKLLALSIPGLRRQRWLMRNSHQRKGTKSGINSWYPLVCCIWLLINIGSQVLVASLSLFWPMEPYQCKLGEYGNISVADLTHWTMPPDSGDGREAAWRYGMDASSWGSTLLVNNTPPIEDLSILPGTPIYRGDGFYEYRFFYRNPDRPFDDYLQSNRSIQTRATCEQFETDGKLLGKNQNSVNAKVYGALQNIAIPTWGTGAISYIGHLPRDKARECGSRCTSFTVFQLADNVHVNHSSVWFCKNTVSGVEQKADTLISVLRDVNDTRIRGTDDFAKTAAGAVSWTGFKMNNWNSTQFRLYPQGTSWSPEHPAKTSEIEDIIMCHTIGAIAAFDDHGLRYEIHINKNKCERNSQRLNVGWRWIGVILGAIALIQLAALWYLLSYADRSIVRDASFFSTAMLLKPVLKELDGEVGVMAMSGAQIKDHEKLRGRRIKYDYKGEQYDAVREVTVSFEDEIGQPKKQERPKKQGWPSGSYT